MDCFVIFNQSVGISKSHRELFWIPEEQFHLKVKTSYQKKKNTVIFFNLKILSTAKQTRNKCSINNNRQFILEKNF